ncbi:MAG TPA: hypothetical protein VNO70_17395, partial [Blastocatellia bacterium]|nr:hypothetical protein [Blastocatellia bacterium]
MKDRGREEQRGHQRHANRPASLKDVWADYLKDGYFERVGDEDCLRVEYVSYDRMNRLAAEMASQGLTKTQLRRFFSHCRAIEIKLKGGASWESVRPLFLKLR